MLCFIIVPAAYVAGSVNFSIILFKILGKQDPRTRYSGNAGVTNVYRQAGIVWAVIVLLLDVGRSVGVGFAALYFMETSLVPWAGLALILGNRFPLFHGFRGGKGVANYLGFTAVVCPAAAAVSCAVWVVVYAVVRVPFIASFFMIACMAGGTAMVYAGNVPALGGITLSALVLILNHRKNIVEMLSEKGNKQ